MQPTYKTYKTDDGVYDIPEVSEKDFLKDYPNAQQVNSFKVGKDTFDIPVSQTQDFLKDNPQAQSLSKNQSPNDVSRRPSSYPLQNNDVSQRPEPIKEGFSSTPNMGEPLKPLPINVHPDQQQVQPQQIEKPSIENNFGLNHNQLAAVNQPVSDNTANVAPQQAITAEQNQANIPEFNKEKADYKQKVINNTPQAITNAAIQSLKQKGIDPNNSALLNKEKSKFADQIASGDAAVGFDKNGNPGLVQTPGALSSFWNHIKGGVSDWLDSRKFKNMDTDERVKFANDKANQISPYIGTKPTEGGSVGALAGDVLPTVGRYAAGAAVGAGLEMLAPETGGLSNLALKPVMSFAMNEGTDANLSGMNGTLQRYYALKQHNPNNLSDKELMDEATKGEQVDRDAGVLQSAVFSGTGNVLGKSVTRNFLKETAAAGIDLGAKSAAVEGAKDVGHNIDNTGNKNSSQIGKDMLTAFDENAPMGVLLHGFMGAVTGVAKVSGLVRSGLKYDIVTKMPPEQVTDLLNKNVQSGAITPEQAQSASDELNQFRQTLNKVPSSLSDETKASAAGLILKRDNIEAQNKNLDPTAQKSLQPEIDAINQKLKTEFATDKPLQVEENPNTGKPYEQPTYDDVAQQNVEDLANKISKGKKITDPEDLQTQSNFFPQLKEQLNNIVSEEKKSNEGKENPKTDATNNISKFLSDNEPQNTVETPQANTEAVSRETEEPKEVSNEPVNEQKEPNFNQEPESAFPKPDIPLQEMNSQQLEDYSKKVKTHQKNQEVEFFGEEGAKKYRQAERVSASPFSSYDERHAAYKIVNDFEAKLTPKQRDEFDAINAPEGLLYDPSEIRDVANRVRMVEETENLDELASSAKNAAMQLNEKKPTVESNAIFNAVRKRANELNIPPESLVKEVVKKVGNQYKDENDAQFMMRTIMEKLMKPNDNSVSSDKLLTEKSLPVEKSKQPSKKPTLRSQVDAVEPTDAYDIVLQYFGGGNFINTSAIKELFGGKKDSTGKDISTEGERRSRVSMLSPDAPSIKVLAHRLWDNAPEEVQKMHNTEAFREAIETVLNKHKSGSSAAKEFIHRNAEKAAEKNFTPEEYDQISGEMKGAIDKHLEGMPEDTGFDPELLSLPNETSNLLDEIVKRNTENTGSGEPENAPVQSSPEKEKSNEVKETEKLLSNAQDELRVSKESLASKKKDLYKNLQDDQQDLFGERKSDQNQLFNERADQKELDKSLNPFRERVNKAQQEVERLNKVLEDYKNKPTAQLEIKLNKSEESLAKRGITNSGADKILENGLTPETLKGVKEIFDGGVLKPKDYQDIKTYLDENKRPVTEPAADGQENTGNDGDKGHSNESQSVPPAEQPEHEKTDDTGTPAEVSKPVTKSSEPVEPAEREDKSGEIGKVAFARSNSYDAYKILHPNESVEDYNKVRNSDVEIPTGDLRKLSKEYAKQKSQEAFNSRVDGIADKIISKISFKGAEGATKAGIGDEEIIRTAAKIIKAAYSAKENIREAVEKAIDYIKQHLFVDKESEDNIRDQFNGVAAQFEKARHLTKVIDMVRDGKTDEQIMDHLSRKGVPRESALAILGDAKTNQVTPEEKAEALDQATKKYNKIEDEWLGEKSLTLVNSRVRAKDQQDAIKKSNDTTDLKAKIKSILDGEGTAKEKTTAAQKLINALHAAKDWRNIDKAIHIYLDLKRNPDHYEEYYNKLTPQQKAIADLSKNLNPEQLKIADEISKEYDEIGKMATDQGLIKEALDNYVSRAWDFGKNSNESGFKFTTSTRHSLERSLDTILQGQAEGLKLKLEGATNNLQTLKVELGNVIENKKLIDKGFQTKVDTGLKDENGKPITESYFSVEPRKGYAKIENPFFKKWTYIGKAGEGTEANGKNIKVVGDAILEKKDIYAPESAAKSINNILGKSKFDALGFTKFARFVKQSILSLSGFHYIAFTRAHLLSGKFTELKGISPRKAYKDGLSQLHSLSPEAGELIKGGLTIGRQQDWTEGLSAYNIEPKTQLGKMVNQFHKHLFETYGAGLKTFDAVNLYRSELIKNAKREKPLTREQVAANVSKLMNDTYGGENFQKMRGTFLQNPTNRHLLSLGLLAPDWTISNLRQVRNAFVGNSTKMYRNMWFRILTRGAAVTLGANALMTLMDDKDKDGNQLPYWDAFEQRYQKSFDAGRLKSLMVDMTPLYHMAGGDKNQRAYFSIFGAYTDPLKLVNNPVQFLENKTSPTTVKIPLELLTGENWQQKRFTDVDELLGIDDKGTYSKTIHAHKMGDISTTTGKAYVRDQKGHEAGENKGGKLRGQLVKYDDKDHGPVSFEELPSFTLSQVRGMMPTALQSIYQGISGENDWAKTMFQAPGTGVMFGKEGAQDKEKTLFNLGKKIYDKVTK